MKKMGVFILLMILAALTYAQQEQEQTAFFGVMTNKDLKFNPMIFFIGYQHDFHFFEYFMIRPEFFCSFDSKFGRENFFIAPGLSLNYSPGQTGFFYFGAGICKRFYMFPSLNKMPLELKLNAGVRTHNRKLRFGVFFQTPFNDAFQTMAVGFLIGYGGFWI